MLLEGLHLPLTTPFYSDGRINLAKLEHNVARYTKTPAAGLIILSGFGEATLLSEEESRQALRSAVAAAGSEKVMLAGASRDSVAGTLDLAETAAELTYDAVLVGLPSILRGRGSERVKELLTYFQAVADRSPVPVVLSSGSDDGNRLPAEVVIELAAHPQILGVRDEMPDGSGGRERVTKIVAATAAMKRTVSVTQVFRAVTARMNIRVGAEQDSASGGDLISAGTLGSGGVGVAVPMSKPIMKTRSKTVGFQVLVGRAAAMLDGLTKGAVGVAPGFAASAPQACYEVFAAWKDGDEGLSREKQDRLYDVARRVEEELGVAGIKFGCDLNGYFGGRPRLPLLPLSGSEQAEVESLMHSLKN